MARKAFDSAKALEITITDLNGQVHELACASVSKDMADKINKIIADKDFTPFQMITEQLAVLYGGESSDYDVYDMRVLLDVLNWTNEQIKNRK